MTRIGISGLSSSWATALRDLGATDVSSRAQAIELLVCTPRWPAPILGAGRKFVVVVDAIPSGFLESAMCRLAAHVVCTSHGLKNHIVHLHIAHPSRISVLPFPPRPDEWTGLIERWMRAARFGPKSRALSSRI